MPELVELRNEFVEMRPSTDDADTPSPTARRGLEEAAYQATFAHFDTEAVRDPPKFDEHINGGIAGTLINILRGKDSTYRFALENVGSTSVELALGTAEPIAGTEAPALGTENTPAAEEADAEQLARWQQRIGNAIRRYEHACRWTKLRLRSDAGLSLIKLFAARDALNPELKLVGPDYEDSRSSPTRRSGSARSGICSSSQSRATASTQRPPKCE